MSNQVALITGASGGIGLALANVFASQGYNLVLVARNEQRLEAVKHQLEASYPIGITNMAKDLLKPSARQEIFDQLDRQQMEINILVNNAGFGQYGSFQSIDAQAQLDAIRLNIEALTHLTRLVVPRMIAQKRGKILNVASTAAFQPGPFMAVYYASKAYVLSFSEALASELIGHGIVVTALCPGPTKTDFFEKQPGMAKTRLISRGRQMSAAEVAEAGYEGLMAGQAIVIPGFKNKLLAFGTRLLPRNLVTAISKWTLQRVQ